MGRFESLEGGKHVEPFLSNGSCLFFLSVVVGFELLLFVVGESLIVLFGTASLAW